MTFDEDPTRWTSSPEEAPELLRGAFAAGRDEGPNRAQMRSLALKIAAASAGGAVAVGTVKATSAGQAVATAASWSVGKIATVVALAGTLVTGGAVVWNSSTRRAEETPAGEANAQRNAVPEASESATNAPVVTSAGESARAAANTNSAERAGTPVVEPLPVPGVAPARPGADSAPGDAAHGTKQQPSANAASGNAAKSVTVGSAPRAGTNAKSTLASNNARIERTPAGRSAAPIASKQSNTKPNAPQSEIELLHRAQVALQARPREAFQLTQEHRKLYPAGEFAQERDALAIQALMRVGDTEKARDLAEAFIRAYPSSPHAHGFREAMGLH